MSKKIIVSIEDIEELMDFRSEINRASLNDIQFTENGEVIEIPQHRIDHWNKTGLDNISFITSLAYKEDPIYYPPKESE